MISWDKITKMINEGKKNGDPLANLIYKMNWVKFLQNFNII